MLVQLRSSRDENNLSTLKDKNSMAAKYPLNPTTEPTGLCTSREKQIKKTVSSKLRAKKDTIGKENDYSDKEVIDQLIHGLFKLPSIAKSNSMLPRGKIKSEKFTLDKLLI